LDKTFKILSTAPLPETALKALSEQKIQCDVVPMIETEIAVQEKDKLLIQQLAQQKKLVLFTSAQAVLAVQSCLENRVPDWQVCCISGATRKAVVSFLGDYRILASANDAVDLLKEMQQITPQQIVFFCGNKRLDTLPNRLAERGFELTELEIYHTKLNAKKFDDDYNGLLFFSPSGVESYLIENTIPKDSVLFSIGKTTAAFLKEKVANEIVIAAQPDKNIIIQTLIEFYKNKRK
jgi:uroporphyrinogen-III synthase